MTLISIPTIRNVKDLSEIDRVGVSNGTTPTGTPNKALFFKRLYNTTEDGISTLNDKVLLVIFCKDFKIMDVDNLWDGYDSPTNLKNYTYALPRARTKWDEHGLLGWMQLPFESEIFKATALKINEWCTKSVKSTATLQPHKF